MADDAVKEQIYTIPLRSVKEAPRWKRSTRAVKVIRAYLTRHMKVAPDMIKLDKTLNEKLWERGSEKPPLSIRVRAAKFDDGEVQAELA
ncbi:50S ribosomal protein L31e [Methanolobus halotolerans]|uniref:Large ribosomal subunit protein eL31 n=1 Tax=Methanolobus halotolerans TaxID=2052935 RepID=A0A4E0Q4B7_9EURY|nr:50S ribosomal protein L31e [Methanolobus halotolerans]TGC08700.1 50S ribosomal protein L31e [Methanolobus halotolerans]